MKRYSLFLMLIALLALAIVPVTAQECEDEIGCVVLGADDPVVIGYALTVSGSTAYLGEDSVGGIQLALLARENELLGREIVLVGEDTLCSAEGGQAAAQRLATDPTLLGVIGTSCSSEAASALPILSEAGLVLISPSNTAPSLTDPNTETGGLWMPGYYRTAHNDLFQGAVAAQFAIEELGATTLATIHDGSPYADGLQSVMATTFAELGGEVVFQGAVNVTDTDMSAILTDIASNPPDILYFPVFEPASNFIAAQARQNADLANTVLMSADGSLVAGFPSNTGDAAIGAYLSGPFVSGETYSEFLVTWDEEIGGVPPSGFHAHAYDATNLLLNALEAVAVEDADGNIVIGRQALRDALNATEGHPGLIGTLTCDEYGDCGTGEALAIFQISEDEVHGGNWPPAVVYTPKAEAEAAE
jgi:branched-chain amino acid transport system substrate-binding protein